MGTKFFCVLFNSSNRFRHWTQNNFGKEWIAVKICVCKNNFLKLARMTVITYFACDKQSIKDAINFPTTIFIFPWGYGDANVNNLLLLEFCYLHWSKAIFVVYHFTICDLINFLLLSDCKICQVKKRPA